MSLTKDFCFSNALTKIQAEKVVRYFIYHFFKESSIQYVHFYDKKTGVLLKNHHRRFSYKRPFGGTESDTHITNRDILQEPHDWMNSDLFVLRHYEMNESQNPVFCVSKQELFQLFLSDITLSNCEYAYIFDKTFQWYLFVTDSESELHRNMNDLIFLLYKKPETLN